MTLNPEFLSADLLCASPRPGKEILSVKEASRGFGKTQAELRVLDKVNLSLRAAEKFGLLGLPGQGKWTLLRIFPGLIEPTRGEVNYQGKPLEGPAAGVAMV